jgi:hypothetical protein
MLRSDTCNSLHAMRETGLCCSAQASSPGEPTKPAVRPGSPSSRDRRFEVNNWRSVNRCKWPESRVDRGLHSDTVHHLPLRFLRCQTYSSVVLVPTTIAEVPHGSLAIGVKWIWTRRRQIGTEVKSQTRISRIPSKHPSPGRYLGHDRRVQSSCERQRGARFATAVPNDC